ncbi:electron transfer flavoprotein subunit alpha/FixB family protein [Carnobacterium gallinarum]|uniref:electron transfer flavoprotein subunit alpha/FixB family protein n=1 Tax=Carnobacterium gallinarum TaxID=2749 RepID=UPI00054ED46C|nr:electron transfer flavoprotein subunit alpha/FixB family protein [Carnobacterium gallinarum]
MKNETNIKDIVVYVELENQELSQLSLQLISKANELTKVTGGEVSACLVSHQKVALPSLPECLAELKIFQLIQPRFFIANHYAQLIIAYLQETQPLLVLVGSTPIGKAMAPIIAVAFKTGLTADCTDLLIENQTIVQVRPAYGGNVLAEIVTKTTPKVCTIREHAFSENLVFTKSVTKKISYEVLNLETNVELLYQKPIKKAEKQQSRIKIIVGKGVKKKADLELIEKLSKKINGEILCSRGLVERGWFTPESQVGLSGKSLQGDIVITLGVSGSVQFCSGIKNCSCVIAVNNDPNARIFSVATYSFCSDLYEVVESFMKN